MERKKHQITVFILYEQLQFNTETKTLEVPTEISLVL